MSMLRVSEVILWKSLKLLKYLEHAMCWADAAMVHKPVVNLFNLKQSSYEI